MNEVITSPSSLSPHPKAPIFASEVSHNYFFYKFYFPSPDLEVADVA